MLSLIRNTYVRKNAPTLLFIHGFMGSSKDWEELATTLPEQTNVAAITLPGHIDPEGKLVPLPEQLNFDTLSATITESIRHKLPLPIILVGYSLGGRVAMHIAVRHPELLRHLVIISAHPGLTERHERETRYASDINIGKRLETESISKFLSWWYSQEIFSSLAERPELLARLLLSRLEQNPKLLAEVLRRLSTGLMEPLWDALPWLSIPVTYIVGELDGKFCKLLAQAHQATPDSILCVIPRSGHMPQLEEPALVASVIGEMLKS